MSNIDSPKFAALEVKKTFSNLDNSKDMFNLHNNSNTSQSHTNYNYNNGHFNNSCFEKEFLNTFELDRVLPNENNTGSSKNVYNEKKVNSNLVIVDVNEFELAKAQKKRNTNWDISNVDKFSGASFEIKRQDKKKNWSHKLIRKRVAEISLLGTNADSKQQWPQKNMLEKGSKKSKKSKESKESKETEMSQHTQSNLLKEKGKLGITAIQDNRFSVSKDEYYDTGIS